MVFPTYMKIKTVSLSTLQSYIPICQLVSRLLMFLFWRFYPSRPTVIFDVIIVFLLFFATLVTNKHQFFLMNLISQNFQTMIDTILVKGFEAMITLQWKCLKQTVKSDSL